MKAMAQFGSAVSRLIIPAFFVIALAAARVRAERVFIVDVMALPTPAAIEAAGSLDRLQEEIRVAVVNANLVLQNSQAGLRFRLTSVAPVEYAESGSMTTDLLRLRTPDDGVLDEAFALRDAASADLAMLVTATGDAPFASAPGPSAANAFSVIRWDALKSDLAAALGRNFGCQPQRASANGQPSLPFAYGYTLNAPSGLSGTCESIAGTRLAVFSNPNLTYENMPLGVPAGAVGARIMRGP